MFRLVTVIGLIGIASVAKAGPVRMTGDDIKRVMQPGAVLEIDTPLHIGIPVTVAHGGIVSAEAGALGLTLGALKDRGRWWTEGDQLCMKWFRWFDAKRALHDAAAGWQQGLLGRGKWRERHRDHHRGGTCRRSRGAEPGEEAKACRDGCG